MSQLQSHENPDALMAQLKEWLMDNVHAFANGINAIMPQSMGDVDMDVDIVNLNGENSHPHTLYPNAIHSSNSTSHNLSLESFLSVQPLPRISHYLKVSPSLEYEQAIQAEWVPITHRKTSASGSIARPKSLTSPPITSTEIVSPSQPLSDSRFYSPEKKRVVTRKRVSRNSQKKTAITVIDIDDDSSIPYGNIKKSGIVPFEWENCIDDTSPVTFIVSNHHIYHPSATINFEEGDPSACCTCPNGECNPDNCECANYSVSRYGKNQLLMPGYSNTQYITECTDQCSCAKKACYNRVMQPAPVNPAFRLQVFKTEDRGWGIRTLTHIPANSYVCEYVGEVISEKLADARGSDEYLWTPEESMITGGDAWELSDMFLPHTIDAQNVGHVARFVNHSCDPNLIAMQVLVHHRSPHIPRIGFYARKAIKPNTELTVDYNYPEKPFQCLCGANRCKTKRQNGNKDNQALTGLTPTQENSLVQGHKKFGEDWKNIQESYLSGITITKVKIAFNRTMKLVDDSTSLPPNAGPLLHYCWKIRHPDGDSTEERSTKRVSGPTVITNTLSTAMVDEPLESTDEDEEEVDIKVHSNGSAPKKPNVSSYPSHVDLSTTKSFQTILSDMIKVSPSANVSAPTRHSSFSIMTTVPDDAAVPVFVQRNLPSLNSLSKDNLVHYQDIYARIEEVAKANGGIVSPHALFSKFNHNELYKILNIHSITPTFPNGKFAGTSEMAAYISKMHATKRLLAPADVSQISPRAIGSNQSLSFSHPSSSSIISESLIKGNSSANDTESTEGSSSRRSSFLFTLGPGL